MVVALVLLVLFVAAGLAALTGHGVADSRDPQYSLTGHSRHRVP